MYSIWLISNLQVNWKDLLTQLFRVPLQDDTQIIIQDLEYLEKMQLIIISTDTLLVYDNIAFLAVSQIAYPLFKPSNETRRMFCIQKTNEKLVRLLPIAYLERLTPDQMAQLLLVRQKV